MIENNDMYLADSVLHRVVQIVQEGFLLGVDVSDLLRQIRLTTDETEPGALILTNVYSASVDKMHEKYLEDAKRLAAGAGGIVVT
jgi:hypothetical protein